MARYSSSYSRRSRRVRRWIYIILALVIIAAVIAFVFGYCPFSKGKTPAVLIDTQAEEETKPPVAVQPKPEPEPNLSEIAPAPVAEPNSQAAKLIDEAVALINAEPARIIEARDRLNELLPMAMSRGQQASVRERLSELADKWLFNRKFYPQDKLCSSLKVVPGSLLSTIGKQHKVPYEILMEINKIPHAEALQAGETIKVINGPFHARVYRSTFTMDLYLQNTFVRSFPVGLGKPDMETPTGLWLVKMGGKLVSPVWTDPVTGKTYEADDPNYPLGSRWIGLEGIKGDAVGRSGFAIHGTKDPNQIGTAGSQGCIRLHNGDAILIYNLLMPGFSRVEVVD